MASRGRKSAASQSVVTPAIDGRPAAPHGLTKDQQGIWDTIVGSEPADHFASSASQHLLRALVTHLDTANSLAAYIDQFDAKTANFKDLDRLLKMRDRETKAANAIARALRITHQSRYDAKQAATRSRGAAAKKPWHDTE
jgi:hypothetical protein